MNIAYQMKRIPGQPQAAHGAPLTSVTKIVGRDCYAFEFLNILFRERLSPQI